MKALITSLLISVIFIISGCELIDPTPKPTAGFTMRYSANGLVYFNLSASHADSFTWDFGDGEGSSEKMPNHTYKRNGKYIVKVTVKGDGGEVTATESVDINSVSGSVMFWMKSVKGKLINVSVDGKYYGQISGYYSNGTPECGAQYCVTIQGLSEGLHSFEAKEADSFSPSVWNSTVRVTGGQCTRQQLTY